MVTIQFFNRKRTRSKPGIFDNGLKRVHFQLSANMPDLKEKFIIFVRTGGRTSIHAITEEVGIGSSIQVFLGGLFMSLRNIHEFVCLLV